MQPEKAVQIVQRSRPAGLKRQWPTHRGIILVAMGWGGGQSIQRAAQDHDHQAAVAGCGGKGETRARRAESARGAERLKKRAAVEMHSIHLR